MPSGAGPYRSTETAAILRDEARRPSHSKETQKVLLGLADGFEEGYDVPLAVPTAYADALALAFHIPSRTDGESGVLVPWGEGWWLLCPADSTLYMSSDDDFEDCHDPSCEWIEDVHRRAGQVARIMATPTPGGPDA